MQPSREFRPNKTKEIKVKLLGFPWIWGGGQGAAHHSEYGETVANLALRDALVISL